MFDHRHDAETDQGKLAQLGVAPADVVRLSGKGTQGFAADRSEDNRGFWETLKGVFVSDDDQPVYEAGVRQGSWPLPNHRTRVKQSLPATENRLRKSPPRASGCRPRQHGRREDTEYAATATLLRI